MRINIIKSLIISLLIFVPIVSGQTAAIQPDRGAQQIWELAIEAKGGREKLHSVKNMVEVSYSGVRYSIFKTYKHKVESLSVFPDKVWLWDDNRPSVFGLNMSMYNYTLGMKYYLVLEAIESNPHLVPFELNEQKQLGSKMPGLIYDLMETFWLKPIPQSTKQGKVDSKAVDIVETIMDGERYDFALDVNTHLPLKVSYYYFEPISKKNLVNEIIFSNYKSFDGIMMPTKLRHLGESGVETLSYQFNVEYDESIFTTPPPFEAGPEAWKKK